MINGGLVLLRPLEKEDVFKIPEWRNRKEVRKNYITQAPLSKSKQGAWFDEYQESKDKMMFAIEAENQYIGVIWLYDIDHINQFANIGILIGEEACWGKGYGSDSVKVLSSYAFCELNLRRITAYVLEYNKASIEMFLKNGYQLEGCLREARYYQSEFWDVLILGLLRDEFLATLSKE